MQRDVSVVATAALTTPTCSMPSPKATTSPLHQNSHLSSTHRYQLTVASSNVNPGHAPERDERMKVLAVKCPMRLYGYLTSPPVIKGAQRPHLIAQTKVRRKQAQEARTFDTSQPSKKGGPPRSGRLFVTVTFRVRSRGPNTIQCKFCTIEY